MSHYDWAHAHIDKINEDLKFNVQNPQGLISAHGDKFSTDASGIYLSGTTVPYHIGVVIGLLIWYNKEDDVSRFTKCQNIYDAHKDYFDSLPWVHVMFVLRHKQTGVILTHDPADRGKHVYINDKFTTFTPVVSHRLDCLDTLGKLPATKREAILRSFERVFLTPVN